VRELADMPNFPTGLRPGVPLADYERSALEAIRAATAAVRARAPRDAGAFQAFLVQVAEAAANAHREGGILGFGGVLVTAAEAAAIARVKRAAGIA
jgi:hypothetical protein